MISLLLENLEQRRVHDTVHRTIIELRRRYTGLLIWFEQILLESFLNICELLYALIVNLWGSDST